MTKNESQSNGNEHIITALEAHWYKSRHVWNEDKTSTEQITQQHEASVDDSQWQWEYWCSCGAEFNDWDNAQTHLQEVNTPNNKTK